MQVFDEFGHRCRREPNVMPTIDAIVSPIPMDRIPDESNKR